jgi:hypothetical protein
VQKKSEHIEKIIDSIRILLEPWLGDPQSKITERSAQLILNMSLLIKYPAN